MDAYPRKEECAAARYTDDLLKVVKNGLPQTDNPKHVIIVGAGIAGLTAGQLLKDAGHKVGSNTSTLLSKNSLSGILHRSYMQNILSVLSCETLKVKLRSFAQPCHAGFPTND